MAVRSPDERIYRAVMAIPRGRVATYGQIARVAGMPRHHRQVGHALRHLIEWDPLESTCRHASLSIL